MKIEYRDKQNLKQVEKDDSLDGMLPTGVGKSFRKKINFIKGTLNEGDIVAWQSLRYEKLKGERKGQKSIRLNDQWRLIFETADGEDPKFIVLGFEDYHD